MSRRHVADDEHPVEPLTDEPVDGHGPTRAEAKHPVPKHLGRGSHAGREPRHRGLKITALVVALLMVAGAVFAGVQVMRLQGNLVSKPLNLDAAGGSSADQNLDHQPIQILVLGTDTRTGSDSRFGNPSDSSTAGNSDVMMLVQISADRKRVAVVSFPRDLMVHIPACKDPESGKVYPAKAMGQLNSALASGGPGCTVAAINRLTGLNIDHFMMADFNAVTELSRTLGGVDVCVNQAIDDPDSGLKLPAGVSSIEGDQALAFLRTRHGFGNGGDEGRIRAQQSFLASMVRKVKSQGTLTDVPRLYSIAETITKNLTVDDQLAQIPALINLATQLQNIDLSRVAFVTAPVEPYTADPNRLQLKASAANPLFARLRADEDLTAKQASPSASASSASSSATASHAATHSATASATPSASSSATATATDTQQAVAARADVPVAIRNVSGTTGRDKTIAAALVKDGYTQAAAETATGTRPGTQVFYGAGYEDQARALATVLGISRVQVVPAANLNGVRVDIGKDFTTGTKMTSGSDLGDLNGQTADQQTCQSAFGNY
ncbi:LCP family protein [Tersicoccus sp. MR15.9]|uniref:LCP family protein n=1 Tax=Tersicoccus mangrovi TaxID=3121635 RepID=UPI002FE62A6B